MLDTLNLDGVILLSNYRNYYLGNPLFEPLFSELNQRKTITFIHPTEPIGFKKELLNLPPSLFEFVAYTTRTLINLLFSGTLLMP